MSHHKRRRPKQRRSGCLMCKMWKLPAVKKAARAAARKEAFAHEERAM